MKLYAPKYYREFRCIASRCRHSCCIGWEIDVDQQTLARYRALRDGYGRVVADSIDESDTPHFRLGAGERCPHLNETGLCRIILSLGEEYLCEICREHPRFYHRTPHGMEVGLGMACEEACRIILASDDYAQMVEIGSVDAEEEEAADFDATALRQGVYALLADRSVAYAARREALARSFALSDTLEDDTAWRALLSSLEYLNEADRQEFLQYSCDTPIPPAREAVAERALAYFILRHGSDAKTPADFRAALGLSLLCERLLLSMTVGGSAEDFAAAARMLSEEIEYSEDNTQAILEMFYDEQA